MPFARRTRPLNIAGHILLGLGGLVCLQNIFAAFIRYPLHRRSGGTRENYRHMSPVPLLGSLFVAVGLFLCDAGGWVLGIGVVLALLDTGGLHWIVPAMIYSEIQERRE